MIRFLFIVVSIMSLGVFTFDHKAVPTSNSEVPSEVVAEAEFDTNILHVQFCGDTLPLHLSQVAKRYQTAIKFYDHPSFQRTRSRARREMKLIEPILKKHGIPADFKYIPYIESAMNPEAVSPRGAAGYWQFMPATAQGLGLVVNDEVDERKDLIKSTKAAAKYLKWLYSQLGDWTLVAAAYNAGPNKIIRQMDLQDDDDYFDLKLSRETSKYVFRLVAVKEWTNRPEYCHEWTKTETLPRIARFMKQQKELADGPALAMADSL
ncbi:lytic transglycosylase domain-containing protein [Arundinibacter roseus]|uniref:Lytic transglycosylase domain-containing protein n=1 Tax=Arundinibacter roseus TaxID=2070510 RepID=A0A4R4KEB5_9BACT|nr:lytic transglycosylase domain-containing protein [Arundinibacter roseus]TDB66063.1 lytic transglycosylase domain-containing protein [Arundinibacter roseus]